MSTKTVLALCTGNSCCSQMAEVLFNHEDDVVPGGARVLRFLDAGFCQPR